MNGKIFKIASFYDLNELVVLAIKSLSHNNINFVVSTTEIIYLLKNVEKLCAYIKMMHKEINGEKITKYTIKELYTLELHEGYKLCPYVKNDNGSITPLTYGDERLKDKELYKRIAIFTTTEALNYNLINMGKFIESKLLFNPDFNYNEESKNIIPWAMDEVSDPSNTPPCKEVKPEEELPALKTQHKIINENKIICVEGSHGKYNKKLKCFITDFTYDYLVNMLVINVVGKDLINMQAAIDLALSLDSEASNVMVYLNRELDISYSIIHGKWVSKLHKK